METQCQECGFTPPTHTHAEGCSRATHQRMREEVIAYEAIRRGMTPREYGHTMGQTVQEVIAWVDAESARFGGIELLHATYHYDPDGLMPEGTRRNRP